MEAVNIRLCTLAEIESADNFVTLLDEYTAESAIPEMGQAQAQFEIYRRLEDGGGLRLLGAFQGEKLIGFLALLVSVLPHFGKRVASTESFFVAASARGSGAGLALLRAARMQARAGGAIGLFVSTPAGGRLECVLTGKGFRETNRIFFTSLVGVSSNGP